MAIRDLTLVSRSGEALSASATTEERRKLFPPLGIIDVVRLRWDDGTRTIDIPVDVDGKKLCWVVLPDRTGLCLTNSAENAESRALVLNDDGTIRFELQNPWPKSDNYDVQDAFGFSYPCVQGDRLGAVIWVWSKPSGHSGVAVEHYYEIDASSGEFGRHHPVR
jgi:hypothetical protein